MKIVLKFIMCFVTAIHLIICGSTAKPVDEMVARRATVISTSVTEIENEFEYEIETEDGNLWVIYGDSNIKPGTKMVVVFYTFESSDVELWDVLDFWVTQK